MLLLLLLLLFLFLLLLLLLFSTQALVVCLDICNLTEFPPLSANPPTSRPTPSPTWRAAPTRPTPSPTSRTKPPSAYRPTPPPTSRPTPSPNSATPAPTALPTTSSISRAPAPTARPTSPPTPIAPLSPTSNPTHKPTPPPRTGHRSLHSGWYVSGQPWGLNGGGPPGKGEISGNLKRKGEALAAKLETKCQETLAKKTHVEKSDKKITEIKKSMNKDEYFNHVYSSKSASDILLEWLIFKRRFPTTMLPEKAITIIDDVNKALDIDNISKNVTLSTCNPTFKQNSLETPILDALGIKLGYSLNFLCPPTKECLLCGKSLAANNQGIQVPLHGLSGPILATKFIWRCRDCTCYWKLFAPQKISNNVTFNTYVTGHVNYHPDMFGTPNLMKFYPQSLQVGVTRASTEVYFTSISVEGYFAELHHGWLSAESKAESYNETHRGSQECKAMERFARFHPKKMAHFDKKTEDEDMDVEVDDDNPGDQTKNEEVKRISRVWEMKRKSLKQAMYYHLILKELNERNMVETKGLGGEGITLSKSANQFMADVDKMMTNELYEHLPENCSKACEKRGCRWVITMDGLWKLSYPICMWDNKFAYPQDIVQYLPNVCPEQPASGKAFCTKHCTFVESIGKPSGLRAFIAYCGADPDGFSPEEKNKVGKVLEALAKLKPESNDDTTFADLQGVGYLLRSKDISNQTNFEVELEPIENDEEDCRKDIGDKVLGLQRRSRGFEAFVTGGGIIKKLWPIYKSEGPTQVALLAIRFLSMYLADVDPKLWPKFFLAFDNMCNIDSLKLLRNPLALEGPDMPYVWQRIQKIIDPLHIKNHKRKLCHEKYNPEKVRKSFPEANMMVCEQTFAWLGRFKKVLNSTPKVPSTFLLHRLVVARNSYTEHCYKENRKPLLPSAKVAKASRKKEEVASVEI